MSDHIYHKCGAGCIGCQFCDGGLLSCVVCGQAEGELEPSCPGPEESAATLRVYETGKVVGTQQEKAKWVTAFRAYQSALSQPYFDQDDESRQTNRNEVQRCFDNLKALAEGE